MDGETEIGSTATARGVGTGATLRILAVGNMYPPHHAGGYEIAWQQAMRHARSVGHEVRILTTDHREEPDRTEEDPDVHRRLRWYWDLNRYEFPRLNLVQRTALERHNARELRHHLERFDPDVVTWWSMGCMSLSLIEQVRRMGVPAMFVVHDDWLAYGFQHDQWIRLWRGMGRCLAPMVERVCRVPARVDVGAAGPFVFNSRYTMQRATEVGLDAQATTVIYPGIDDLFLTPLDQRPWQWRLAYVGRIDRQKGIDTAVSALEHLPAEATLDVWGTGDAKYVEEMRALARRYDVAERLRFRGFAPPARIRAVYGEADVIVFPVRWNEPFGLVPLEAMGLGRAVVSTARGGPSEFLRDGENALLFDADDPAALAACVARLAENESLRRRLRAGGIQTAAGFTAERFAADTVEEIIRVGTRGRATPPR